MNAGFHVSVALAALALSSPAPDPPDSSSKAFAAAVGAAARESGGAIVGVTAVHVESGRRLSHRGEGRFQMASVFKLPVAIAVFGAAEKGTLRLDEEVEIRPAGRGAPRARPGSLLLSRPSTDRILDAMRRCATGDRRLRAGVPKGTEVLDKTGTVGRCANDAGIVRLPDGTHLAIVVFTRGGRNAGSREEAIARVARAAWQAFAT